jgi:Flp pilus assembly protein TadD
MNATLVATRILGIASAAVLLAAPSLSAQSSGMPDPAADLLRQGQQKMREGRPEDAIAIYRQALQTSPRSFSANSQLGVALDLTGKYADARSYFSKAIEFARSPEQTAQAQRSMAMSYAFEGDCGNAARYETPVYEMYVADKDFFNAGEIADELARVCIDAGNLDEASKWYKVGHDTGLREPDIKPDRRDLWEFRWEHAQARIAARSGNKADAQKHMAAAKAILDRGTNPQQLQFFPYLAGYVALYGGDYSTALEELQNANQSDPFIICLIGETYEKVGDRQHAEEHYRKAATMSTAHNPPNAFARALAKKKLG